MCERFIVVSRRACWPRGTGGSLAVGVIGGESGEFIGEILLDEKLGKNGILTNFSKQLF